MTCKVAWELEFIEASLGKTYFNTTFKKFRRNAYYEYEKTQLPACQELAKDYVHKMEINAKIKELTKEYKEKNKLVTEETKQDTCTRCIGYKYVLPDCVPCHSDLKNNKIRAANLRILQVYSEKDMYDIYGSTEGNRRSLRLRCQCRGWLNDRHECSCGKRYCLVCLKEGNEEHECQYEPCECTKHICLR
jgi:hypothetical protein